VCVCVRERERERESERERVRERDDDDDDDVRGQQHFGPFGSLTVPSSCHVSIFPCFFAIHVHRIVLLDSSTVLDRQKYQNPSVTAVTTTMID
jgi:hypothetical protein